MFSAAMKGFKALVSGNMRFAPPSRPLRGVDAVYRDVPCDLEYLTHNYVGNATAAGAWGRCNPYFANALPFYVVNSVHGAGVVANSGGTAGRLIDPAYLLSMLPGATRNPS